MQNKFILVDGSGYIFRAFYALPPISRSDGLPVGAIYGFCSMLLKLLADTKTQNKIIVVFDKARKNFRNDIYKDYKANRTETPADLIPQFQYIRDAVTAFNLPVIEQEGFEADDIIATYAKEAENNNDSTIIYSSDKDLMQLLNFSTEIYDPLKNKYISIDDVIKKFGVTPNLVTDIQALIGDSTDNIPGIKGIGIKTATELINKYGSLENLLTNARNIKQDKRRELILEGAENAIISKKLATLKNDIQLLPSLYKIEYKNIDKDKIKGFLFKMEFNSLSKKIDSILDKIININNIDNKEDIKAKTNYPFNKEEIKNCLKSEEKYSVIQNLDELKTLIERIKTEKQFSIKTITSTEDFYNSSITAIGVSFKNRDSFYIPISHTKTVFNNTDLLSDTCETLLENQIPLNEVINFFQPVLENTDILKIGYDIKRDLHILNFLNIKLNNFEDIQSINYTLHTTTNSNSFEELINIYLDEQIENYKDICGTGKAELKFNKLSIDKASNYICKQVDYIFVLYNILKDELENSPLKTLYNKIDRPLIECLYNMERQGIIIDTNKLKTLSDNFENTLHELTKQIYLLAGEEFNIASPKQLGDILFNKLKIPYPNKTKLPYSTDTEILHSLQKDYPITDLILKYREISKLKNTYTDALPKNIFVKDRRIHTTYIATNTATGRLSSNNPNLQNIPVRSDYGKKIREAFIAHEGYKIISADYSQIELRVMAVLANVKKLQEAFEEKIDIHKKTAKEVFNIPENEVSNDIRRKAKAINFGIIYGISPYGLAKNLNISNTEASDYIENYFKVFPEIKEYMTSVKTFAHNNGYVETLFKRKLFIQNLNSPKLKAYAERMAINATCQGTAADIIKIAMINLNNLIKEKYKNKIKMLLQVHDELIFEVSNDFTEEASKIIKSSMENIDFKIPLIVEIGVANNWNDAH